MEAERPGTALVNNTSILVDQVDAIRPPCVLLLRAVVEGIDQRGKLNTQLPHAHAGNVLSFINALGTGENNVIANVALHLPDVTWMGFQDVHRVKLHARSVIVVQLV